MADDFLDPDALSSDQDDLRRRVLGLPLLRPASLELNRALPTATVQPSPSMRLDSTPLNTPDRADASPAIAPRIQPGAGMGAPALTLPNPNDPKYSPPGRTGIVPKLEAIGLGILGGPARGMDFLNQPKVDAANRLKADTANTLGQASLENTQSEIGQRQAETANVNSQIAQRAQPQLEKDSLGNVVGWRDQGGLHSLDEPGTPDSIKQIAGASDSKPSTPPHYEKLDDGSVIAVTADPSGKLTAERVYKGDPKVETQLATLQVNGQPHSVLVNKSTGERIKDLGVTKSPDEGGSFMPLYDASGKVVGAWNAKSGQVAQAPAALPGTTSQGAGIADKVKSTFEKAYVQPAETVEKSYEMMDNAYKEYQAARAQGKELPTGAQSMLALSTHLSTTFGNVKGSRVTKEMIQEHLGARSVSDTAQVAFQKLTNGDVLSPAQWTAFHDLIGESRKLSWQIAAKEAARQNLPVDFLPPDLQGAGGTAPPTFADWQKAQKK